MYSEAVSSCISLFHVYSTCHLVLRSAWNSSGGDTRGGLGHNPTGQGSSNIATGKLFSMFNIDSKVVSYAHSRVVSLQQV